MFEIKHLELRDRTFTKCTIKRDDSVFITYMQTEYAMPGLYVDLPDMPYEDVPKGDGWLIMSILRMDVCQ